jgi:squalene-hopene/tetraprenyl-beta-curcumene cyclase
MKKRLLGLLTTWSERILSAAPERVQQQARQKVGRLLRLVGGNPSAFLATPDGPRRLESGQILQGAAQKTVSVDEAVKRSQQWHLNRQSQAGYWVHELEADTTLTSEYLMLRRFLGLADPEKERKAVRYLIDAQLPEGGWPIYSGGPPEISASVKAYFALKLSGTSAEEPFMQKARAVILSKGGVVETNVFTKIALALFDQYDWRGIPTMPVELVLLRPHGVFSLYDLSYWSRAVLTPLLIVFNFKPVCRIPKEQGIDELYSAPRRLVDFRREPPFRKDRTPAWRVGLTWRNFFITLDGVLRVYERFVPERLRKKALAVAAKWMIDRMEGEGGLGAIYPAMANSIVALRCLGYEAEHPLVRKALGEIEALEVHDGDSLHLQPCFSPVWDTPLTINSLIESGLPQDHPALVRAANWTLTRQCRKIGDWIVSSPQAEPGGWYFQYENECYPDNDDTAVVVIALSKLALPERERQLDAMRRAVRWTLAMQGSDGGWGAYDKDNNKMFLNQIPFADHRALLDPGTADLTGRELEMLGMLGYDRTYPAAVRALRFLRESQEADGSWYGRWGVNYIYGTWSVLAGLNAIGEDMQAEYVRRAVAWLVSKQNSDGGWGESCLSYAEPSAHGVGESTPSQTAWALLGLLCAGEAESLSVVRGVNYLLRHQSAQGSWPECKHTGTGFPRVFYLRYHGYSQFFSLWALSMYRSLKSRGRTRADEIREQNRAHGKFRLGQ